MADLEPVIPDAMRGWIPWDVWYPPPVLIQVACPFFEPMVGFPSEFDRFRASLGRTFKGQLYWRLTGIGRERIENFDMEEVACSVWNSSANG